MDPVDPDLESPRMDFVDHLKVAAVADDEASDGEKPTMDPVDPNLESPRMDFVDHLKVAAVVDDEASDGEKPTMDPVDLDLESPPVDSVDDLKVAAVADDEASDGKKPTMDPVDLDLESPPVDSVDDLKVAVVADDEAFDTVSADASPSVSSSSAEVLSIVDVGTIHEADTTIHEIQTMDPVDLDLESPSVDSVDDLKVTAVADDEAFDTVSCSGGFNGTVADAWSVSSSNTDILSIDYDGTIHEIQTMDPVDLDLESPPVDFVDHLKVAAVADDEAFDTVSCSGGFNGTVADASPSVSSSNTEVLSIVHVGTIDEADTTIDEIQKPSAPATVSHRNHITNRWKNVRRIVLTSTRASEKSDDGGESTNGSAYYSTHSKSSTADTTSTELTMLKAELYKLRKESKMFKANVEKEFKGVKNYSSSTVTQFGMYWIIAVSFLILAALYGYMIFRAVRGSTTTFDALYVYSGYCGLYVVYFLMDVFWNTVRPDRVRCEKTTHRTHVMVAAHRAEESLAVMLPQVLQSFEPHAVWVCDNGYYDGGRTRELCERLGVHYRYNKTGNKANALLATGREIERDYPEINNGAFAVQ